MTRTILTIVTTLMLLLPATVAEAKSKREQPFQRGDLYYSCSIKHRLGDWIWDKFQTKIGGCLIVEMTAIHDVKPYQLSTRQKPRIGYFYDASGWQWFTCEKCKVGE